MAKEPNKPPVGAVKPKPPVGIGITRRSRGTAAEKVGEKMNDITLAKELIRRMNALIKDPDVRDAFKLLLKSHVPLPNDSIGPHPTIQVLRTDEDSVSLAFMGMLNGIVGAIPEGRDAGWGHICYVLDDDGRLLRFEQVIARKE